MKPRTKPAAKSSQPGEHVRVVPLHHPKPSVSIDDLARARRRPKDQDLFDGQPHPATLTAHLTYNGGHLVTNVQVFSVFWGKLWGTSPSSVQLMKDLNQFFTTILVSPLIDQLAEYDVPGQAIGHGSFIGSKLIKTKTPGSSITDSAIQTQLQLWIKTKVVPANNKNTLYF